MEKIPLCPRCHKPLAAEALLGLCPECLLRAGFTTGTRPDAVKAAAFAPPAPADLAPLFPQLEILALVGQGGMGAVYRARQPSLDRIVALKILPPRRGGDPGFAERFTREARALARLNHPNIVAVHEFGSAGDYHYFVMEFVDGVTLRHLLATEKTKPREALAIVPQICDALQFAHDRGIVHRDIKPENILIDKTGAVKIADFGLAKIVGDAAPDLSITGAHDVVGTPHYMAPEQVEHPLEVDHRADIYSVGVVFYQMLTGELPLGRFAPPSRKVQIDVRLDEVVLRALEKEPEHRYQQVSGLKSEVETIATSATPPRSTLLPQENPRSRWLILIAAWVLAGAVLWLQAGLVDRYLKTAGALGLRGADTANTPLRQIYPAFAADAQVWVQHALALLEGDQLQLRHTDIDNAPRGREVHWCSAWAWCIAGAGKLHQLFTGLPLPQAVERATLWLNPAVMFAFIVLLSAWAARYLGVIAGVVIVVAMTGHSQIYEGFFPSYVDHHGLATVAVFGLVLGAVVMGGGWRHAAGTFYVLPGSKEIVRHGALLSGLSGACGLWVSAVNTLPAIAIVGLSGLLAVVVRGRAAMRQGADFDGGSWRLWGRVGAGASFAFYLLEYFPGHLGFRLESNHPMHSLAWLGAGEFIAQIGERWLAPREQRWRQPWALLSPVLAVAVVVSLVAGGTRVFSTLDPFLMTLHRDYIQEGAPLWRTIRGIGAWSLGQLIAVGLLPLVATIALVGFRRREHLVGLWFALFVTTALAAAAWWQASWLLNFAGASIALIVILLVGSTAAFRPSVRWTVTLTVLGLLFVPNAIVRYRNAATQVAMRTVGPKDAASALSRDLAAALRASQLQGDIVLLASPNASASIGYYGRFKTLGTLYWENGEGLKSAARILAAKSEDEAAALVRAHGVTHIAIVSDENFLTQYYRLLHPGASASDATQCLGYRLLRGVPPPPWLEPLPYEVPDDLKALKSTTLLFKVNSRQDR